MDLTLPLKLQHRYNVDCSHASRHHMPLSRLEQDHHCSHHNLLQRSSCSPRTTLASEFSHSSSLSLRGRGDRVCTSSLTSEALPLSRPIPKVPWHDTHCVCPDCSGVTTGSADQEGTILCTSYLNLGQPRFLHQYRPNLELLFRTRDHQSQTLVTRGLVRTNSRSAKAFCPLPFLPCNNQRRLRRRKQLSP